MAPGKRASTKAPRRKPAATRNASSKDRPPIPDHVQEEVFLRSARRCALCFGFDGKLHRVNGQLAHVDRNPFNNDAENIAYLCQNHHDEYDTTRRQTKRLTPRELTNYRNRLYDAIREGLHHSPAERKIPTVNPDMVAHDLQVFKRADAILNEQSLENLFYDLEHTDGYDLEAAHTISRFFWHTEAESNRFVLEDLNDCLDTFREKIDDLHGFLAVNCFVEDAEEKRCLLNRHLKHQGGDAYMKLVHEMRGLLKEARDAFREYRRTVKRTLLV